MTIHGGLQAVVLGLLGVMLGVMYVSAVELIEPAYSLGLHDRIIGGDAGSPYRYRVLVPALLEALTQGFASFEPRTDAFLHAMFTYACGGFVLQLWTLFTLVRRWFSPLRAMIGVLFISGVTMATFSYFAYQPWSILEVSLMALALLFAYWRRWLMVGVMVLLASLNRETGIFVALAVLCGTLREALALNGSALRSIATERSTQVASGLVVLSVAVFGALRLWRGSADQVDALVDVIARNFRSEQLGAAALTIPLFLGLGWLFATLGFRSAPSYARRAARVVPLYLAVFLVWGWWRETRILTTLYPLLLPLILAYCYPPRVRLAGD